MTVQREERSTNSVEAFLSAFDAQQASIWTSLPCIIQSFDESEMTVSCVPAIQGNIQKPDGSNEWVNMPTLLNCPVVFTGGGGWGMYFKPSAGDEAIVLFSSRCIDAWHQSGGIQQQAEFRMHDLSDGMVLVGLRSVPRVIPINAAVEIKNDSGDTIISMDNGVIRLTAENIELNGNIALNGNIKQPEGFGFELNGVNYYDHNHSGVESGSDTSGGVV